MIALKVLVVCFGVTGYWSHISALAVRDKWSLDIASKFASVLRGSETHSKEYHKLYYRYNIFYL